MKTPTSNGVLYEKAVEFNNAEITKTPCPK